MNGLPAKSGPKVGKKKVDDDPPRFCTRIGCSGRIKYARNADDIATIFRRTPPPPVKKPDPRTTKPLQQTRSSARSSASSSSSSSENRRSVNGGKSAVVERSPLESNSVVKKTTKKKKKEIHSEPETSSSSSKAVASAARNDNAAASTSRARPPSGIDRAAPNGRPYRSDRRADPAVASSALTRGSPMFRLDDIGGATEILLALERIEQDEDLTHEQVVALEMSLFLTGLSLYDQYRDMRLDIDHMSYEELLALGERMGTVSTPLSEDELSKCLKRRIHRETSSDDDLNAKCSICQEEYEAEDVIGILSDCGHGYHEACIGQWLRLKNWCPICKASAKQL